MLFSFLWIRSSFVVFSLIIFLFPLDINRCDRNKQAHHNESWATHKWRRKRRKKKENKVRVLYTNEYFEKRTCYKKNNTTTLDKNEKNWIVHFSLLSLLAASFFSLRFRRNDGVRNLDFFSFFTSSSAPLLPFVRFGET